MVFFLLLSATSAELDYNEIPTEGSACCIPFYQGKILYEDDISFDQNYCSTLGDYIYQDNCYDNGELVNQKYFESGCCCQKITSELSLPIISTSSNNFVSRFFCEYQEYTYVGEQSSCNTACGGSTKFYSVDGNIIRSQNKAPLEGITIRSESKEATSDENGHFTFTDFFEEGSYSFDVEVPHDYNLDCVTNQVEERVVKEAASSDTEFYFKIELSCEKRTTPIITCEPVWQVSINDEWKNLDSLDPIEKGGWSKCLFMGRNLGWEKNRNIRDFKECGVIENSPERFTSIGCEDISLSDSCDGTYIEGELCDGDTFFYDGTIYNGGLNCNKIFSGYRGDVTCDSTFCTFDFSDCQSECDCTVEQCDNACQVICEEEEEELICQNCEDALRFIPEGAPSNGDIFDLYEYTESNSENGFLNSPIEYTLGTKDVTINWAFNTDGACTSDLLGFDVMVCQDNGDGNCDTNYNVHVHYLNGITNTKHVFENILEPERSYCYNVIARLQEGDLPAFEAGNYPCFETGDIMCMESQLEGSNCVYREDVESYGPSNCKQYTAIDKRVNLKLESEACTETEVCIETKYVEGDIKYTGASCVKKESCQSCNGMFGLFASYNLASIYDNGRSNYQCEELLFSTSKGETVPGSNSKTLQVGQCFKDESKTLFSFYDECQTVTTCYDYNSKGTCQQDPCFKFTNVTTDNKGVIELINSHGCEWIDLDSSDSKNPIYGEELGLGICRPVDELKQDCELCDTDSPLGFCGKDMCAIYGNCYQKAELSTADKAFPIRTRIGPDPDEDQMPACLSIAEMSCALYDTLKECQGDENTVPIVDVLYSESAIENGIEDNIMPHDRLAGTNKQSDASDDLFNFGDCEWNYKSNTCFKNSNNFASLYDPEDDCIDQSRASPNCFKDTEPPKTTIFLKKPLDEETVLVYGSGELLDIKFGVEDDNTIPEEIETYVSFLRQDCIDKKYVPCLTDEQTKCLSSNSPIEDITKAYADDCYIYPQHTLEDFEKYGFPSNMLNAVGGVHTVLFFSEDKARNLEIIKSEQINIDNSNPVVEIINVDKIVHQISEDNYVTDLIFTTEVSEDSYCKAQLHNIQDSDNIVAPGYFIFEVPDNALEKSYQFNTTYPQLEDGKYEFIVECFDNFKNRGMNNKEITLDADGSITPVSPLGEIFFDATDISLEITTRYDGVCKFDTLSKEFATSRFFFSDSSKNDEGRFSHTVKYPQDKLGDISGRYNLFISCNFSDKDGSAEQITQGQSGDTLVFSIDKIPPISHLTELGKPYIGKNEDWKGSRQLDLECNDANPVTPTGANMGCNEIHYCITLEDNLTKFSDNKLTKFSDNPSTVCSEFKGKYKVVDQPDKDAEILTTEINLNLDDEYTYTHYFFKDRGGSKSEIYTINNKILDTSISSPLVVIE